MWGGDGSWIFAFLIIALIFGGNGWGWGNNGGNGAGYQGAVTRSDLCSEHDAIREKQTKEMASHIPHCEVEVFRDGDHFVAAKQPSRFNRTVIEFLLGR